MNDTLMDYPMSQFWRDRADPDVQEIVKEEQASLSDLGTSFDPHPPRFVDGHWEFWEEDADIPAPPAWLKEGIKLYESRYLSHNQLVLEWQLLQIVLHGMEYLNNPERYPIPKPKGLPPMTKPKAKPPPVKPPSTQPRVKGGMKLPRMGPPDGERPRGQS